MYNRNRFQPQPRPCRVLNKPPSLLDLNFPADVVCNNFDRGNQPWSFSTQYQQPFDRSARNHGAPVRINKGIINHHRKRELHERLNKESRRNDFNKKYLGFNSNIKNVNQNKMDAKSRREGTNLIKQNQFMSYGNISDFCMKLTNNNLNECLWINKITEHTTAIDKQICLFIQAVAADEQFYEKAEELCNTLKEILKLEFPEYEISPKLFGSSNTHLALKDSDYDIYLDFDDQIKPDNLQNRIADCVRKNKKNFSFHIITPIKARVPIVQCKSFTEPSCDISYSKPLGVHNTSLIKFLISLDERIRPVILILKFWLKRNDLLHFSKISSYGLVNLAVFYFQQGPNPILPPIRFLQEKSCNREFVDGWNVSFAEDKTLVQSSNNNSSILDLVRGFLNFYRDFNFEKYAICTYLGKSLLKSQFAVPASLPSELTLYKNYLKIANSITGFMLKNPMWLQDPLVHNYNVARNSTSILEFKKKVNEASIIVNQEWGKSQLGNYKCVLFKAWFTRINSFIPQKNKKNKWNGKRKRKTA